MSHISMPELPDMFYKLVHIQNQFAPSPKLFLVALANGSLVSLA